MNMWIFILNLNTSAEGEQLIVKGKLCQSFAVASVNEQSPLPFSLDQEKARSS